MDETPCGSLNWLPGSFYRKPAWRWLRAGYLAESRRRLDPRIDDDWVALARIVRRTCGRRTTHEKEKCSAIAAASELWTGGECLHRSKLEAYLLTSVPFARIATICGLDPTVVEAYHAIYFDVRSRALATDWLLSQAVGWWATLSPDLGLVWKYLANSGGENILEVAIAITADTPLPNWVRATFANPAFDEARLRLKVKLSIFNMTAITSRHWTAITAIRERLRRLEGVDAEESHGDKMLVAIETLLAASPKRPRSSATSFGEAAHLMDERLPAISDDQRVTSPRQHRSTVALEDDAVSTANEWTSTAEMPEALDVPVGLLEPNHSWRSFDEVPDTADGIDVERERSRVFVAAS